MELYGVGTVAPLILMAYHPIYAILQRIRNFLFSEFVVPQILSGSIVTLMGLSATLSQYLMTKAYEYTKAGVVGTISYTNIVFAIVIGIFLGDSFPCSPYNFRYNFG